MKPHVVAIIPARGGSKGLSRKNIRPLLGKPLIAYTIEAAKQCPLIDRVIVTTEDAEIAQAARACGAEVPFVRPSPLATDNARTEAVLAHAVQWLDQQGDPVDIVVYLQATDIFRKKWMLEAVIRKLIEDPELESAFVAYRDHKNYWRRANGHWERLAQRDYLPRQVKEPIYREDTGLACATRADLIRQGRRLGDRVAVIENNDQCSHIDIHEEVDLWMAEQLLKSGKRTIND